VTNFIKSNAIGITNQRTGAVKRKWIYPADASKGLTMVELNPF
jgi:hypothetical protein